MISVDPLKKDCTGMTTFDYVKLRDYVSLTFNAVTTRNTTRSQNVVNNYVLHAAMADKPDRYQGFFYSSQIDFMRPGHFNFLGL